MPDAKQSIEAPGADDSKLAMALLAALLLAPLAVSGPVRSSANPIDVTWPRVHSGDEPHYLIMISSLINDGDLDLANNYASVHRGGTDAGSACAGFALDHHVNWHIDGRNVYWSDLYENEPEKWLSDHNGHPVPTIRKGAGDAPPRGPEYSSHPPGLALLLAPLVYPFRGTDWIEPIAVTASGMAVVISLFFFRALVRPFLAHPSDFAVVAGVTYLGTPIWHYGRTLYTEPYLLLFTVAAYSLHLRRSASMAAGAFIAAGLLLKTSFAVIAFPLLADLLMRRKWGALCRFCLPCVVAGLVIAGLNHHMYGSWSRMSMRFVRGDVAVGAFGLLFSLHHGLIPFTPAAMAAAAAWPEQWQARRRESLLLLSAGGLQFLLLVPYFHWDGGFCYGPRYLVPVLPLLFAATPIPSRTSAATTDLAARRVVFALYAISIIFNDIGAFSGSQCWHIHPITCAAKFWMWAAGSGSG